MCDLVVLAATWIFEIYYRSGYVGLLVHHLLLLLIESSAHCRNVVRLSLFYNRYFGMCSSKLAELVPFPYSCGRSCRCSNRRHDFSVIRRCCKDVYVNSIFSHTVRLWNSLPTKRFPLMDDQNRFMSTVNNTYLVFLKQKFKIFNYFLHHFLVTLYLVVVVQLFMDWIPVKKSQK